MRSSESQRSINLDCRMRLVQSLALWMRDQRCTSYNSIAGNAFMEIYSAKCRLKKRQGANQPTGCGIGIVDILVDCHANKDLELTKDEKVRLVRRLIINL